MSQSTATEDPWAEIEAMQEPTPWIPETEGDTVAGIVVNLADRENTYGPFQVITLETRGGLKSVATFSNGLKKRIGDLDLGVGDALKVTYGGIGSMEQNGKKIQFKKWQVAHKSNRQDVRLVSVAAPTAPERIADDGLPF